MKTSWGVVRNSDLDRSKTTAASNGGQTGAWVFLIRNRVANLTRL